MWAGHRIRLVEEVHTRGPTAPLLRGDSSPAILPDANNCPGACQLAGDFLCSRVLVACCTMYSTLNRARGTDRILRMAWLRGAVCSSFCCNLAHTYVNIFVCAKELKHSGLLNGDCYDIAYQVCKGVVSYTSTHKTDWNARPTSHTPLSYASTTHQYFESAHRNLKPCLEWELA